MKLFYRFLLWLVKKQIPYGSYCYKTIKIYYPHNDKTVHPIHKIKPCPYFKDINQPSKSFSPDMNRHALCLLLEYGDDPALNDMCKCCGINDYNICELEKMVSDDTEQKHESEK